MEPWEGTRERVQRGSRPPHARSEIFLAKRRPGTRPAHVEKRRHGGPIKAPTTPPVQAVLVLRSLSSTSLPFPFRSVPFRGRPRRAPAGDELGVASRSSTFLLGAVVVWFGGTKSGGRGMVEEGPADLRELVRLPDVLVVCSSTGWTDERHMLYLRLLEESFVSQLHDGECGFKGLFNHSPWPCRRLKSSKQTVKCENADQGCLEIVEGHRPKSCIKVECIESPCCGSQQDGKVHSMNDNASTTEPIEEVTSNARPTSTGQSSTCYSGKHRHSPSRSAEGSDQNFDEETKGIGESGRGCNKKRLKSADDNDQVVPSMKAESQQAICLNASDKDGDNCNGSSKAHAGLPDAEAGSLSCKNHGPKG